MTSSHPNSARVGHLKPILDAYPSIGTLAKVCGAIAFILEHPVEIDAYLNDQERRFANIKAHHPLPADMQKRYELARRDQAIEQG